MTANLNADFEWTEFYMAFADKLLAHKSDRSELVAIVRAVCNDLGYSYLDNSGTADQEVGLQDICPFTVMGAFNRGITEANKRIIARAIGDFLGVNTPAPYEFDGIPTLTARNSVVFWDARDIDHLWQLFEDGIRLADSDTPYNRQSFIESFEKVHQARGVGIKSTMGLFGSDPRDFCR